MKKLLLATGILALSVTAFGAGTYESQNGEVTGEVMVTAKVVSKLKMVTKDVDFGVIVPGETKGDPNTPGEVAITGQAGENVVITLKTVGTSGADEEHKFGEKLPVILKNKNGAETMTANITLDSTNLTLNGNNAISLPGGTGETTITIPVNGSLTAGASQAGGQYEGSFRVVARYN